MNDLTQDELLYALEKAIPEIMEEHHAAAEAWNPHDWVPWDDGRNFAFLGGVDFDPDQPAPLPADAAAAVLALLLTKDNMPSYHRLMAQKASIFGAWQQVIGSWTAEDNRHSIALRDYLVVSRLVDPEVAENLRLHHITKGKLQSPVSLTDYQILDVMALLAVHELQCVAFEEKLLADSDNEVLTAIVSRILHDDRVQAKTFTNFLNAGVDANISELVTAVDKAVSEMELIGADVDNFGDLDLIAKYNADASTYVASTLVADLKLQSLGGLSDKDEAARQRILAAAGL
ncbi:acyl-ACP desaturase [Williamsia muralis]|uniref:Fatty acid desaturase n=1 Tax=Williamsia marianensis TaxID=85044 RepID=A0A2G3PSK6_WILMA|nr:acyl-ACP desaturase [Williamsia marianensis]PHV68741.1 fatty acid desaturase [Williamsia marianensis]PZU00834.1 MAG: fatty acid desaturase [Gordonia sp. (in: high G+C Gram-positive bacteria)]